MVNQSKIEFVWFLIAAVTLLAACDRSNTDQVVLAVVNGEKIYQHDLDQMLNRMLGEHQALPDSQQVEKKALESLVMMRAISQKQEQVLSGEERLAIDSKTNRYREELLLQMYLKSNTPLTAPSESEVKAYYEQHLDKFGGGQIATYQILQTNKQPVTESMPKIMKLLAQAKDEKDWQAYAAELKKQDSAFIFVRGRSDGPHLHKRLLATIEALSENEVSPVIYLDKKPHIVKVTKIENKSAKPLSEARTQIRKSLAAQAMKKSIKKVADDVLKQSDVQYMQKP